LNKDRDKLIDKIFTGAVELSGEERDTYVVTRCGDDDALKQEVLSLLRASEASDTGLNYQLSGLRNRLLRSVFDFDPDAGEDLSGQSINGWRFEKRIARGGLATVYLAHRDDGEFDQTVALKVLRRGLDTDDLITRFRAERQILSSLEHPSISRILDGGALDDGRPYLVLEFVDGLPITTYCEDNSLSVRHKVELMIEVLRPLHHAHKHLVVHRDVKPSNILVSANGKVSLLDFGIAKLLDPSAIPGASTMTRTGVSLLTPGYGSPEQHAGSAVTTASDIYQSGLVLYEMLTGKRPFETQPEQGDPVLPLASRTLRGNPGFRNVRGDLDAIIRKATHGDPAQRYSSANEMLADLQRFLDRLPVIARPDSIRYRLSKLAKRRPLLFPLSALAVLGAIAYIATITIYSQRLAREEQLAATSQQFLIELFQSPDPFAPADSERGSSITVVEALAIGRKRIDNELSDQPEMKASLLRAISEVYGSLDVDQEAMTLRQEALALERQLYGDHSPEVIASLRALGLMYRSSGDTEKADQLIAEQLASAYAVFSSNAPELGLAEIAAGVNANDSGQIENGRILIRAGLEKLRPERLTYAKEIIGALIVTAENHGMESQEQAYPAIEEAQRIAEEVYGESTLQAASVQIRLASSMTMYGDYQGSERNFREALPVLEERLGKDHGSTLFAMNNLGYLYARSGELEKAEPIYKELVERQIGKYGTSHRSLANSYQNLGGALTKLGRYDESIPLHRQAYEIYKSVLSDDNYIIAFPLLSISYAELQQQNPVPAKDAATEALQRFEATVPGTFLEGVARCLIGLSLEQQGQVERGSAMVLGSHELMQTGSIPDPYPALCRLQLRGQ